MLNSKLDKTRDFTYLRAMSVADLHALMSYSLRRENDEELGHACMKQIHLKLIADPSRRN